MLSNTFKIMGTLALVFMWFLVLKIVDLSVRIKTTPQKLVDLKNRIVATIHAVMAFLLCSYGVLSRD